MGGVKVGIREVINELEIKNNKIKFINELNLFLNLIAFDENKMKYCDVIKKRFYEYMKEWDLDIEKSFYIIAKYVKIHKLPYKIVKDEGFNAIKSEKFIVSMLVDLYFTMIIINNDEYSKEKIKRFIYNELRNNKLVTSEKNIVLNEFEYLFKDKKVFFICKKSLNNRRQEIENALNKIINAIEERYNIKLRLNYLISRDNNSWENVILEKDKNMEEIDILKYEIDKLKKNIQLSNEVINEYIDKEAILNDRVNKLQIENIELVGYAKEQYAKALIDLVQNMNESVNGNLLDRLYCYSKGSEETNLMFVATNLFNVLREMGVFPRETIRIGEIVKVEEYSFYNYRLNKDISDIKFCEGKVLYPSWFYNSKEILKPYVNIIKGD